MAKNTGDIPWKDLPETLPPPAYGHYRMRTWCGWSWAIEWPATTYSVRDANGRLVAKGAKTWKRAADWALANCHRGHPGKDTA